MISYLGLSVRHCRNYNPDGEHSNAEDLNLVVALSPNPSNNHRRGTTSTPKDDMHGNRYIVTKGEVIEQVYNEENKDVRKPS